MPNLDEARKKDVAELERVLRTSKNPREIATAKSSLRKIDAERYDSKAKARRDYMLRELERGRIENVRGIQSEMREYTDKYGRAYK